MSQETLSTLKELRKTHPAHKKIKWEGRNLGERASDYVAENIGSWRFIIIQTIILLLWIAANIYGWLAKWDPYPFILLNLVLSFQAAFTAPIIMMSQNRQSQIDRLRAKNDYDVNIKAELEIELLHTKIDEMREKEIKKLIEIISDLEKKLPQ